MSSKPFSFLLFYPLLKKWINVARDGGVGGCSNIFKKRDPGNYRAINLTVIPGKILEKIFKKWLRDSNKTKLTCKIQRMESHNKPYIQLNKNAIAVCITC